MITGSPAVTVRLWIRASGDNGSDDSVWFFLDGDGDGVTERPLERIDGNQASMTGFQPQTDFVWRSDAQDPPDPFTVEIPAAGPRAERATWGERFFATAVTAERVLVLTDIAL